MASSPDDQTILRSLLPGYGSVPLPTLESIGGEQAVLAAGSIADGTVDVFTASISFCASWSRLVDHGAVTSWLRSAIDNLNGEELLAFNDVVLASPKPLADLASTLAERWAAIADADPALRGNIAMEAWTRLAVGGWTAAIPLRGALYERAERSSTGAVEPDIFLVRSLGAALDQWGDAELERALELLSSFDEIESDVAFELGMSGLRRAVAASAIPEAIDELNRARQRFDGACLEGDRPDALAFSGACTAVATFLAGGSVAEATVAQLENSSREWFMGYLGETPHWRQPRAETGGAWALLVHDLYEVRDIDSEAWYEPAKLLDDVGRIYCAYNSSTLLADPSVLATPEVAASASQTPKAVMGVPLPVALGPRLDSALGKSDHRIYLVNRWLQALARQFENEDSDEARENAAAAEALRAALSRGRKGSPGKAEASRKDGEVDPSLREALLETLTPIEYEQFTGLAKRSGLSSSLIDRVGSLLPGARPYTPLDEQLLLARLLQRQRELMPIEFPIWQQHLALLQTVVIRIVKDTIDHEQGGARRYPWHRVEAGKTAHESTLADHLALLIYVSTGLPVDVEMSNRAGGRADVVVTFGDAERLAIEVKRITEPASDSLLVENYGDQAGQYTLTGPPFAFLAVLDLNRWASRLPIAASFWVAPWAVPTTGETRALTSFRVLADVATPSTLSR